MRADHFKGSGACTRCVDLHQSALDTDGPFAARHILFRAREIERRIEPRAMQIPQMEDHKCRSSRGGHARSQCEAQPGTEATLRRAPCPPALVDRTTAIARLGNARDELGFPVFGVHRKCLLRSAEPLITGGEKATSTRVMRSAGEEDLERRRVGSTRAHRGAYACLTTT